MWKSGLEKVSFFVFISVEVTVNVPKADGNIPAGDVFNDTLSLSHILQYVGGRSARVL